MNIHSNGVCYSNSFKIMFGFHVLLITDTGVGWYLMPASDGCSIILYERARLFSKANCTQSVIV